MLIRDARFEDLPAVVDIFNASIDTTCTWSDHHQTLHERETWFDARTAAGDAVLVADDAGHIVGFAAYADFRDTTKWPGYRFTVEHTVHVREGEFGRGVGRALLTELMVRARDHGKHMIIAAVDAENPGSLAFHEALGFVEVGRLREVGWKFEHWLDLVLLQRRLDL